MTRCDHVKVYGRHFDQEDWARWTAAAETTTSLPPQPSSCSPPPPPRPEPGHPPRVAVRKPKPTVCKKKAGTCTHVIAFGDHFNRSAWQKYADYINEQHAQTDVDNLELN